MPPKRRNRKWEEDMKKKRTKRESPIVKRGKLSLDVKESILGIPNEIWFRILTMAADEKTRHSVILTCKTFRDLLENEPIMGVTFNMDIDQITNSVKNRIHSLSDHSVERARFVLDPKVKFSLDENVRKISGLKELEIELLNRYMGEEKQIFRTHDYTYSFKHPTVKRLSLKISDEWDVSIPDIMEHLEENLVLKILELYIPVDSLYDFHHNEPEVALESLISFLEKNYERYNSIQIVINDDDEEHDLGIMKKHFKKNASFMKVEKKEDAFIEFSFVAKK